MEIEETPVNTPLEINSELLQAAIALDEEASTEAIVETALREYIQRRQQLKQEVMIGAAAADRGDLIDGETAMNALKQKLDSWRNQASS
jgi:predicted transcriptional regulator